MIKIKLITVKNFNDHSLDEYERRQDVKRVYRKAGEEYVLTEMPYTEDWDADKKRSVARDMLSAEYIAYAAFDNETVAGFIGLKKQLWGGYMILDMMHVSAQYRGKGIGRSLFEYGIAEAKRAGAKALYISACSSEETIAFYRAMGAELTNEPIREIAEEEPFDLQLVCSVL